MGVDAGTEAAGREVLTLQFHDIIEPDGVRVMPTREHVEAVLRFGSEMETSVREGEAGNLLVHCHMGISRSTAAMVTLMAQGEPDEAEEALFTRLREIRPRAWPNSVMIGYADAMLGRKGRLLGALRRHYALRAEQDPKFAEWMRGEGRGREVEMAQKT